MFLPILLNLGETVTVNASATGGSGSYTFAYYSREFTQKNWTAISNYSTNATASFTAKTAGYYQVCVKVKDSDGTVAKEYYNIVVGETQQPQQNEFKNTSTVSATQVKLGERVGVTMPYSTRKLPIQHGQPNRISVPMPKPLFSPQKSLITRYA